MHNFFQNFDFAQLNSPDFKEDSVREVLILPLLQQLGYNNTQIVRSKTFQNPFVKTASGKRALQQTPDYLLRIADSYAWVLDAKAPNENITDGGNVEQAYFYAIHPEVRTKFFALCNGKAFSLFRHDAARPCPILGRTKQLPIARFVSKWQNFYLPKRKKSHHHPTIRLPKPTTFGRNTRT